MNMLKHHARLVVALLVLVVPSAAVAAVGGPYWSLTFENDTPKSLVLEGADGKLNFYWYLIYRVANPGDKPLTAEMRLTLRLELGQEDADKGAKPAAGEKDKEEAAAKKQVSEFQDIEQPIAERHLEKQVAERALYNWAELSATPMAPGEKREGVAIFAVGNEAPDFDTMTIFVRGLAELRPLGRTDNVRKFRQRVLFLNYRFLASRWRAGRELKYAPEEWHLEEIEIPDRASAENDASDDVGKRLKELIKQAEDERKRRPAEEPKPPPKSSARPAPGLLTAGPVSGKPAPDMLKALRRKADEQPHLRAVFKETVGTGPRRREAGGTVSLGREGKFAAERILDGGTERALKEIRIFDGKSLWIHTAAKDVGDIVRRWTVEATKKEWHTADGRPEVDFATLVNPVRAWCLFGSRLLYIGVEQLSEESAYVLEASPDPALDRVLEGPLSGELLGKAAGKRVRFWIGSKSLCQRRMEIYDARREVVASLECSEIEPDAVIDPRLFTFTPPPGVEVTDMNAAIVDNSSPKP